MQNKTFYCAKITFLNLAIVALIGLLMRYKIVFEFPFFNQKYLQHSHSHFAFSGWVSQLLMVFMVDFLERKKNNHQNYFANYKFILYGNLVCAYGMLFTFMFQGYAFLSIFFSTSSIIISFVFAYLFWKDVTVISPKTLVAKWFKTALIFNVISAFGTFFLAYMMSTKNIIQDYYLGSIYYYLHFQYNGWFLFACLGLFFDQFSIKETKSSQLFFQWLALACVPTYGLSILWLQLPKWLYIIVVVFTVIQTTYWFVFLNKFLKHKPDFLNSVPKFLRTILAFVGFALSLKFLLQLGTTIPEISKMAFGIRTIVIAYLHLVLLAIISLYLLFYAFASNIFELTTKLKFALILFAFGVILNEVILAVQGLLSLDYTLFPFANELLFLIAIILFIGAILIFVFAKQKKLSL